MEKIDFLIDSLNEFKEDFRDNKKDVNNKFENLQKDMRNILVLLPTLKTKEDCKADRKEIEGKKTNNLRFYLPLLISTFIGLTGLIIAVLNILPKGP